MEETIPISATEFLASKRGLKSSNVILKTIRASAKTTNIEVKIFIYFLIRRKTTKKTIYIYKPLTLPANILTAVKSKAKKFLAVCNLFSLLLFQ